MRPARVLLLALLVASGCAASRPGPRYATRGTPWTREHNRLYAGVASVDITPPALLGLAGHGPESRVAVGTLGHLRCRVFYLSSPKEDGTTSSVALIPCDLAAVSGTLHRAVTERLDGLLGPLGRQAELGYDRLFLMATHTHAGPSHYFEAVQHAGPFWSSLPGFDPNVVDFLARRIAAGVATAVRTARPAVVGWHYIQTRGLTRNRSMTAFGFNPADELPARLRAATHNPFLRDQVALPELAVDRRLALLRVDTCATPEACVRPGGHQPLGDLAVFGAHPTALSNTNDLYHGDVFAHATQTAESALARDLEARARAEARAEVGAPVVGIANGIGGDVATTWNNNSPEEMVRLGDSLAEVVLAAHILLENELRDARVSATFIEPLLSRREDGEWRGALIPRPDGVGSPRERVCARPEFGAPGAGGAPDHPTRLRIFRSFNEGERSSAREACHGSRIPLQLVGAFEPGRDLPNAAPMGLISVGRGVLATVPVEVTTVAGMRITERLEGMLSGAADGVALVGLTNAYLSYVTTAEEYEAQAYEGATNLYGPRSADFYSGHLACMVRLQLDAGIASPGCAPTWEAFTQQPAEALETVRATEVLGEESRPEAWVSEGTTLCRERVGGADWWRLQFPWDEPETYFLWEHQRVEVLRDDGRRDVPTVVTTSERDDVQVRYLGHDPRPRWEALWRPGFAGVSPLARAFYRIRVLGRPEVASEWFRLDSGVAPCR